MIHRQLEVRAGTPAKGLPAAVVADLLDRGDLDDWLPLARAVAADPYGRLAARIVRLVDAYPMYGTSSLWRAWIDRCRLLADGAAAASLTRQAAPSTPRTLTDLRRAAGWTQAQVATRLGISQSDVSKLEHRSDLRVATLRRYLHAIGLTLRLRATALSVDVDVRLDGAGPRTERNLDQMSLTAQIDAALVAADHDESAVDAVAAGTGPTGRRNRLVI